METYAKAQARILRQLAELGLAKTKPFLKAPQAVLDSGDVLYFKAQAVYLNKHSLFIDIRDLPIEEFLREVQRATEDRKESY
jgi:hypothetical protein